MSMTLKDFFSTPPTLPLRIESDGKHVYSSEQISIYGLPETWIWPNNYYEVISNLDFERPAAQDFKFEQERWGSTRPIHRYSRVKRFESTLYQLLGYRGNVDLVDLLYIKEVGYDEHPLRIWESLRRILKENGWQKYYNRIPTIIQMLGLDLKIHVGKDNEMVNDIIRTFKMMNSLFEDVKPFGRTYFPNMRFIVIRMLETFGAKFDFDIPRVRTKRKLKPLDEIWVNLFNLSLIKINK